MSYEVLARKWRPRSFEELVGQEHVRRALVNALDRDRLHHAYLFTGTRGVGKTTIARILAKSLNCETHGVTSTPCGECSACQEIDAGRFIDLIEVDAASRTKVEETRELLENVPYAPTRGRYKVYLIDEVHMFSGHSFNALLKTLEEPPAHVKFLLATTDPQKVPVTILSRCLQFNLKLMPVPSIVEHLERIVAAEGIDCETAALGHIARAATGSMRDALSLLDQAIAFGQGAVRADDVESMLGTLSRERLFRLAEALAARDGSALLAEVAELAEAATDLEPVLVELQSLFHQLAVAQTVPEAVDHSVADRDRIHELAARLPPAEVQLYHQIATLGRRDMAWAPDPRGGLEMTLLRMLAFRPADSEAAAAPASATQKTEPGAPGGTVGAQQSAPAGATGVAGSTAGASGEPIVTEPVTAADASTKAAPTDHRGGVEPADASMPTAQPTHEQAAVKGSASGEQATDHAGDTGPAAVPGSAGELDWNRAVAAMNLRGLAGELAANTVLVEFSGRKVCLALAPDHAHLGGERYRDRLAAGLAEYLGHEVRLEITEAVPEGALTPAELEQQAADARVEAAADHIQSDPVVQALQDRFGATVETDSVRPAADDHSRKGHDE